MNLVGIAFNLLYLSCHILNIFDIFNKSLCDGLILSTTKYLEYFFFNKIPQSCVLSHLLLFTIKVHIIFSLFLSIYYHLWYIIYLPTSEYYFRQLSMFIFNLQWLDPLSLFFFSCKMQLATAFTRIDSVLTLYWFWLLIIISTLRFL